MTVVGLFRTLKNFLLSKFSADSTALENALPEYMLGSLLISAAEDDGKTSPSFSAPGGSSVTLEPTTKAGDLMSPELKAAQDAAAAATLRAEAAESKIAASAASARSAEFAAQAATLVTEARLHPDEVEGFVAFMAQPDDKQTVEFSAPDGTKKSFDGRKFISDFIKRRAPLVEMKEVAKGKHTGAATAVAFSAPPGTVIDNARLELHHRAVEYAAQHKVEYLAAVKAVQD
jgi:hypothetical protein